MKISSTAERLLQFINERNLKQVDILRLAAPYCKKNQYKNMGCVECRVNQ